MATGSSARLREFASDVAHRAAGRLRLLVFRIDESKVTFEHRGVPVEDPKGCERLEGGARYFSRGFAAAMADTRADSIARRIGAMDPDFQGFAFEGAGMTVSVLDGLVPGKKARTANLLAKYGDRWSTLIHIGIGWTYARAGKIPAQPPSKFDPFLGWLIFDGAGFHEGFLKSDKYVEERQRPDGLSPTALRVFDQGVGRALLFVRGDNVEAVRDTIARFPEERHPDLWSGVGLAATYAGGLGEERVRRLRELAHPHGLRMAQGSALATMARVRGGNVTADTAIGSSVLCGGTPDEVAARAEAVLAEVPPGSESALEDWQARLRESFSAQPAAI
jgi:hypothetical protein